MVVRVAKIAWKVENWEVASESDCYGLVTRSQRKAKYLSRIGRFMRPSVAEQRARFRLGWQVLVL